MDNQDRYSTAVQDFRNARRQAAIQDVLGILTNKSQRLLSFEEVRSRLGEGEPFPRGLQEIPLDAIVGSVGRYSDFTRKFLPKREAQSDRWAKVRIATEGKSMPPIELYKLGEVYFVLDGNHRVSIARQQGAKLIEAYVTEIPIEIALTPDDDADQMILKVEESRFLKDVQIDKLEADIELRPTTPGRYGELRDHIAQHQYFMGLNQKREIDLQEAARDWLDQVYLPTIQSIRRKGLLRDFPDRTETDLYLWLMKYRNELSEELGWDLEADEAAIELGKRFSRTSKRLFARLSSAIGTRLIPKDFERGPAPGEWRKERNSLNHDERLFRRILVAVSGEKRSWRALDQAILIAKREEASLRGLHVLADSQTTESSAVEAVRKKFEQRLAAASITGRLVVEKGEVGRSVERRSRWSDLAVLHLMHPPEDKPAERLRSGVRGLVQRVPRPMLFVPKASPMENALLAFDGSRKSIEALFIAAYAFQKWGISLSVITAHASIRQAEKLQRKAYDYLQRQSVRADYELRKLPAAEAVLHTASEKSSDLILMGGYGSSPLLELVVGSTLDQVLREFKGPVLICR